MPLVQAPEIKIPFYLSNRHVQTIFPSIFRKIEDVNYERQRINTPDDDFIDLDWSGRGSPNLVVIAHGLEGNSERAYMKGMVRAVNHMGWDALAYNFRACSGEPNRTMRFYHSGATDDLHHVVMTALNQGGYKNLALIGFSLGGNMVLKYLGEKVFPLPPELCCAAAISAPCDLAGSSEVISSRENRLYMKRFLKMLHEKIRNKMEIMPGILDDHDYDSIKTFREYDNRYTAPIHGFKDAEDYWEQCSSIKFLDGIEIPSLVITAKDDPMLSSSCIPLKQSEKNRSLFCMLPHKGGHVGFMESPRDRFFWHERQVQDFFNGYLG